MVRRLIALLLFVSAPAFAQQLSEVMAGRALPITAQERQQGTQANPSITAQYGGKMGGRQAAYVESVGRRIASQSGLGSSPSDFDVTLLNSSVDNAFAIPGGYIYVTRNLLALMNDEAELAGVMGHEVGHVAARHGAKRESAAKRNAIFGALGQAIAGAVIGDSAIGGLLNKGIGTGTQLLTLRYSRSQETQADDLGVRYLSTAGYDPLALSTMLQSLADQTTLEGRISGNARNVPTWQSTHPDPGARVAHAAQFARTMPAGKDTRNRDAFLAAIDGMMYGDDPQQGVVSGQTFLYPEFGIAFDVPQGFGIENGTSAVAITGQGAQAQFAALPYSGNIEAYVASVIKSLGGPADARPTLQRTTVNGFTAAYTLGRATNGSTPLDVTIYAYELSPTRAVHFVGITPSGNGTGPLQPMYGSLRKLTTADQANVKPRYVRVVTVKAGDTVQSLSGRMAYKDLQLERFLVLNRLDAGTTLKPGDKVKVVTY